MIRGDFKDVPVGHLFISNDWLHVKIDEKTSKAVDYECSNSLQPRDLVTIIEKRDMPDLVHAFILMK